jgi:hypothetical protein
VAPAGVEPGSASPAGSARHSFTPVDVVRRGGEAAGELDPPIGTGVVLNLCSSIVFVGPAAVILDRVRTQRRQYRSASYPHPTKISN